MRNAVTAQHAQIMSLASVLNSPTIASFLNLSTTTVNWMRKDMKGAVYVFAAATQTQSGKMNYNFALTGLPVSATATVLGENRTIRVTCGKFTDDFRNLGVHLYKITF